ncbi:MAG: PEGA domain-containing protein [Acidobacteriia bacterium]|nr:PEGA domain-containing protein [Terriglobia bacterium]
MQENPESATGTATATGNATASATATAPRTDRLELVKELPRGSVGVVHQARSPQQNRSVVLRKFDVPEWLDDANELIQKILAGAKAASALDHPNIARLYTCGYKDFTVFMTAEFIEGQNLKEMMAKRQPEMAEALQLAKQLLAALDYAHGKGVFHHFLNPYNIKVLPDGTLKLLDFGILRDKNLLTQSPTKKLENEPYLSPEQVKNKPSDKASNLFNAATIIYQLYTARSPFAGPHLGEVDRSITDVNPHPMQMAHPRVPEQISNVVLKALAKNPADRYTSGQQFFAALEEAAKFQPVARANSTGSMPAYQGGPGAANATGARPAYQGGPGPNASQSFNAMSPNASQVIKTPAPGTTRVAAQQTTSRPPVSTANHWKLVGGVVGGLCLIVGLALIFQHRPGSLPADDGTAQTTQSAASTPAPFNHQQEQAQDGQAKTHTQAAQPHSSRSARNAPAAAPVAPPAPTEGQLIVSSMPMGATVEIEGRAGQSWKAPQTVPALSPGTYKVTFSMPGFATETRNVQVVAGARTPLDVRMTAVKGFVTVAGSPAGAQVWINGKDTGKVTPIEFLVEPGTQNIMVRKQGFLDANTELKLVAGQSVNYAPSLMVAGRTDNIKLLGGGVGKMFGGGGSSQGMARIEIKSEPKGAQVTINGTPLQKTTPLEIQVEPGNYDIVIQKDGYKPAHESAIVGVEDRIKINGTLTR